MRVGVLALQGDYAAHARTLQALGHSTLEIRDAAGLATVDGLVLPGGESSTQLKLIDRFGLEPALHDFVAAQKPVLATCAGIILSAKTVTQPQQHSFGWLDIGVARNAWGRQVHSFESTAEDSDLPLVFIRAPRITSVGAAVEVLARFGGEAVWVRQGNVRGATFHPELTADLRVHAEAFA